MEILRSVEQIVHVVMLMQRSNGSGSLNAFVFGLDDWMECEECDVCGVNAAQLELSA